MSSSSSSSSSDPNANANGKAKKKIPSIGQRRKAPVDVEDLREDGQQDNASCEADAPNLSAEQMDAHIRQLPGEPFPQQPPPPQPQPPREAHDERV